MATHKKSLYISFDVECDGNNPLQYSMRSIGMAAFEEFRGLIDKYYVTILPQTNSNNEYFAPSESTMTTFWSKYADQWKALNDSSQKTPSEAMQEIANWLSKFSEHYVIKFVARPSNCDWMWLKCYYEKYGPAIKPDIGYYCHCLASLFRSYCLAHNIRDKRNFMLKLSGGYEYTHHALQDAICQGNTYMNLRVLLTKRLPESIEYVGNGIQVTYKMGYKPQNDDDD